MSIKITWHGHACFTLEKDGFTVAIDPYNHAMVRYPVLKLTANEVYASHNHDDHNYFEAVELVTAKSGKSPFTVRKVENYHDHEEGAKRGKNIIHIFESDGISIAHMGDTGNLLNESQLEEFGSCDVILLPVGGFYTVDAAEAMQIAKKVSAKLIIPMHYRTEKYGLEKVDSVDGFLELADRPVEIYNTDTFILEGEVPRLVAVLEFSE
ncbi:MAG: MBL fold metallo-hydrolase [Ruminococcaceae bacterium]|nr:MBL fold metallo-hydrolase [Oscillospiraceae bacterium]